MAFDLSTAQPISNNSKKFDLSTAKKYKPEAESISSKGLGYVAEHPFKSTFDPALKTLTGKTISDVATDTIGGMKPFNINRKLYGDNVFSRAKAIAEGTMIDTTAQLADMASVPANYIGAGIAKIPVVKNALGAIGNKIATSSVGRKVGSLLTANVEDIPKVMKGMPEEKVFDLYNKAVGGKIRNAGEIDNIKRQRVGGIKALNENVPNLKLKDIDTGEDIIGKAPKNRWELAQSLKQTKEKIWDDVTKLSSGATKNKAIINIEDVANKSIKEIMGEEGIALKTLDPSAINQINGVLTRIKENPNITPTEAQQYLAFFNKRTKAINALGVTTDFSVKDLYSKMRYNLLNATDDAIEKSLEQGGYKALRQKYSNLKSMEKEVISSVNKQLRDASGRGSGHTISDIFALQDALEGVFTGNPSKFVQGAVLKSTSKLYDYMKNPDRKIRAIFDIMGKSSNNVNTDIIKKNAEIIDNKLLPFIDSKRKIPLKKITNQSSGNVIEAGNPIKRIGAPKDIIYGEGFTAIPPNKYIDRAEAKKGYSQAKEFMKDSCKNSGK